MYKRQHSGGAAQIGSIIGRYPKIVDTAILVSCPCNVSTWRSAKGKKPWLKSQSPHNYLQEVAKTTKIIIVNGSRDNNTRTEHVKKYIEKAKSLGLDAHYVSVNGAGHGFGKLSSKVKDIVRAEIQ